jgi:hypothetical protein
MRARPNDQMRCAFRFCLGVLKIPPIMSRVVCAPYSYIDYDKMIVITITIWLLTPNDANDPVVQTKETRSEVYILGKI